MVKWGESQTLTKTVVWSGGGKGGQNPTFSTRRIRHSNSVFVQGLVRGLVQGVKLRGFSSTWTTELSFQIAGLDRAKIAYIMEGSSIPISCLDRWCSTRARPNHCQGSWGGRAGYREGMGQATGKVRAGYRGLQRGYMKTTGKGRGGYKKEGRGCYKGGRGDYRVRKEQATGRLLGGYKEARGRLQGREG